MTRAVPRPEVTKACLAAVIEAEARHVRWSDGITMRAAPESLIQSIVAEMLGNTGVQLLLEVSLKDLRAVASGSILTTEAGGRNGRVDLAVYYKSKMPRFIIEIKKITNSNSLVADCIRIRELLKDCPTIQNGLMLGYTTAAKTSTVETRLKGVTKTTGARLVRKIETISVLNKRLDSRYLGAAVYRVDR